MCCVLLFEMWYVLCIIISLSDVAHFCHLSSNNHKRSDYQPTTTDHPNPGPKLDPILSYIVNGDDKSIKQATSYDAGYEYTEGDSITVSCFSEHPTIRWEVPAYIGLISGEKSSKNNLILGQLDRYDKFLKIQCRCTNNNRTAAITFKWNNKEGKMAEKTTYSKSFFNGEYRSTNEKCYFWYRNKTKETLKRNTIIHFGESHIESMLYCAELVSNSKTETQLKLNKTVIKLRRDETKPTEPTKPTMPQEDKNGDSYQNLTNHDAKDEMDDKSDEVELPLIQIIGGSVSVIVLLILFIITYTCYCRRRSQNQDEDIYSEPNHLVYAEIMVDGHGPLPTNQSEPYAKIIGVVKKHRNPKKISLPPHIKRTNQSETSNKNEESGYAEIHRQR